MWITAVFPQESKGDLPTGQRLYFFLVREMHGAIRGGDAPERLAIVTADSDAHAVRSLVMTIGSSIPIYQHRLIGVFGRREIEGNLQHLFATSAQEPMVVASALRYAEDEYREVLSAGERESLVSAASKIENTFFERIF